MSDCSQVSDGGSALIVVSEDGLREARQDPADAIEVVAVVHATGNLWCDGDPTRLDTTAEAASRAYATHAGIAPKDVGIAEVHDCFTVTELLMMEALGSPRRARPRRSSARDAPRSRAICRSTPAAASSASVTRWARPA